MLKHFHIGSMAIALALLAPQAHALIITQVQSISHSQVGTTTTVNDRFLTPFDPALGTLNSVRLQVTGTLAVSGVHMPNFSPYNGLPIPYPYHFEVRHSLYGLGAFDDFRFVTPATYIFAGTASGSPIPYVFLTPFNYNILFNSFTDLVGFVPPSGFSGPTIPPVFINGRRDDFHDYPFSNLFGGLWMHSRLDSVDLSAVPNTLGTAMNGVMILTYDYTPHPPDDVNNVPEPGTLALLGMGLAGLGLARRKRPAAG